MTQNFTQGGILNPDEVAKAQNEINKAMSGSTGGSGSSGSGGSGYSGSGGSGSGGSGGSGSGRTLKPGDKIKAKDAISGNQSGGMVNQGDKVEAKRKCLKEVPWDDPL